MKVVSLWRRLLSKTRQCLVRHNSCHRMLQIGRVPVVPIFDSYRRLLLS